jgi:DNA polymerase-3 subunit alpha (Gram-positive type)
LEPDEILTKVGSIGIPEFGTRFVRRCSSTPTPKLFRPGAHFRPFPHGTDVWLNKRQRPDPDKAATLSNVILYPRRHHDLPHPKGVDKSFPSPSWKASEGKAPETRMGGTSCGKQRAGSGISILQQDQIHVPQSPRRRYVTKAFRIAWFKVYYPMEYYIAYFQRARRRL